jgi:basic membrane protein A
MRSFAPNAFLTAPVWNWGPLYTKIAQEVKDGTWKSESIWWGMQQQLVQLAPLSNKIPADVRALIEEKTAAIKAGKLHPFAGPVKGQKGEVVIAAGTTPSDGELLGMSYFVEGVQGTIPK